MLSELQPMLDILMLKTFTISSLKTIYLKCKVLKCIPGQCIFKEGDAADFMCFVISGIYKVSKYFEEDY